MGVYSSNYYGKGKIANNFKRKTEKKISWGEFS